MYMFLLPPRYTNISHIGSPTAFAEENAFGVWTGGDSESSIRGQLESQRRKGAQPRAAVTASHSHSPSTRCTKQQSEASPNYPLSNRESPPTHAMTTEWILRSFPRHRHLLPISSLLLLLPLPPLWRLGVVVLSPRLPPRDRPYWSEFASWAPEVEGEGEPGLDKRHTLRVAQDRDRELRTARNKGKKTRGEWGMGDGKYQRA